MIVADTGAILALIDRRDRHHKTLRAEFEREGERWVLPWAILPEVDYLVATELGGRAHDAWLADLADGAFEVEWGDEADLAAAVRLHRRHRALQLGLVDATVMVVSERLAASAIATLDLRHFGAVALAGKPKLLPRDLA
jgi:predicted nucleic acid-binding protein